MFSHDYCLIFFANLSPLFHGNHTSNPYVLCTASLHDKLLVLTRQGEVLSADTDTIVNV